VNSADSQLLEEQQSGESGLNLNLDAGRTSLVNVACGFVVADGSLLVIALIRYLLSMRDFDVTDQTRDGWVVYITVYFVSAQRSLRVH